jgi:3-oxoacyl-[acyl-carrier protein] reductase
MKLKDKVAIVTGSSRGIGANIAKMLSREGAGVVVNYSGSNAAAELLAVYARAGTESIPVEELPAPAEADEWPALSQRAEAICES